MIQDSTSSCKDPAVIEVDEEDARGLRTFLDFMRDPVQSSQVTKASKLISPSTVLDALRFADKYDAPLVALLLKQYARTAPYGYNMLGDAESTDPRDSRAPLANKHRLAAFVLGAQIDDPMMCARMLEANGGTDVFIQPDTGNYYSGGWDAYEHNRVKGRYAGPQAERCHVFDVTGWPLDTLNDVGTRYAGALMRAMRTVGVYYREPDWEVEGDEQFWPAAYGEQIGDWTWAEVAHEFRGYMGLHGECLALTALRRASSMGRLYLCGRHGNLQS